MRWKMSEEVFKNRRKKKVSFIKNENNFEAKEIKDWWMLSFLSLRKNLSDDVIK